MPCGLTTCTQCETNRSTNLVLSSQNGAQVMDDGGIREDEEEYDIIYILDDSFVNNQIDLIDQFDQLSNCVILKSTHENIMAGKGNLYCLESIYFKIVLEENLKLILGSNRMAAILKWNVIQDIIENRDYRNF